jgi:hypothetical protein
MTTEITRRFVADSETARDRFDRFVRSTSFSLLLGKREIAMLRGRPWDPDRSMEMAHLPTLANLFAKGLLQAREGERPQLTEAGKIVRQLLVYSNHIEPHSVFTSRFDVLEILRHAAGILSADFSGGFVMKKIEMRTIDGERHLILRLNEGLGNYSEWAIPESAVRRIG